MHQLLDLTLMKWMNKMRKMEIQEMKKELLLRSLLVAQQFKQVL